MNHRFEIGNGFVASFWHSVWLEDTNLKDRYPLLYSALYLMKVFVAGMGGWIEGRLGEFGVNYAVSSEVSDNMQVLIWLLAEKGRVRVGHNCLEWSLD